MGVPAGQRLARWRRFVPWVRCRPGRRNHLAIASLGRSNPPTDAEPTVDDTTVTPNLRAPASPKRRPRETRELKVKYEIVLIDGEEGRKLHQIQSQAVLEALLWLATNPKPSGGEQPDRLN